MKKLLLVLTSTFLFSPILAEIQDGKVFAGAINIRNESRRSVMIHGYELKAGRGLYLNPAQKIARDEKLGFFIVNTPETTWPSRKELNRLFATGNNITVTLQSGELKTICVPLVDSTRPSFAYGCDFNYPSGPVIKQSFSHTAPLEYDIVIKSNYIFGQKIIDGERFYRAEYHGYDVIRALAYAAKNNDSV